MSKRNLLLVSLVVFVVNFCFKLLEIGSSSFWHDEALSVKNTFLEFGHIKHESEWDANPPFYYYCLWIWTRLFGWTELAVRSMSALFSGLAAGVFFYFLQRRQGLRSAVLLSLLFLLHPFLYYYAQEARSYSLVVLLILLNIVCTENYYQERSYKNAAILGLLNFLLIYTHYITGLYVFVQFIVLVSDGKYLGRTFVSYLFTGILVLIRFTAKQYKVIFFSSDLSKAKNNIEISNFQTFLNVVNELYGHYLIFLLFLAFVTWYFLRGQASKEEKNVNRFNLFLLMTPIIVLCTFFVLGKFTNVFAARYLIYVIPLSLAGVGCVKFNSTLTISLILLLAIFYGVQIKPGEDKKMDYRLVAKILKERRIDSTGAIVLQTHDPAPLLTYYYDFNLFKSNPRSDPGVLAKSGIYTMEQYQDFESLGLNGKAQVYLLQTFVSKKERDSTLKTIGQHFHIQRSFQMEGTTLTVFSK